MAGIEILKPLDAAIGNRRLLDELKKDLDGDDFTDFRWIVAYAKAGPLQRLKSRIEAWRHKGRTVRAIFGIDQLGTSKEALELALSLCDEVYVTQEKGITFHPKAYIFLGAAKARLFVGSNNLTVGGTETNFEAAVIVDASIPADSAALVEINELWDQLLPAHCVATRKLDQSLLNDLIADGDVVDEITIRETQKKLATGKKSPTKKSGLSLKPPSPLPIGAKPPKIAAASVSPEPPILVPESDQGPTIWFETRKMTGGSRNILDLSMKSLVELGDPTGTAFDIGTGKFMRGAVEFFGQDPGNIHETKNVTLRFEGIDYKGNTILFPTGKNANGTWRLQIKGVSSSGSKITDILKDKAKNYLMNKIITFAAIQDDLYSMTVFPDSEIDNFKTDSQILGRNGKTKNAKLLGVL